MSQYNLICTDDQSTVVAEYTPCPKREDSYQSEAVLEQDFIKRLQVQGYEYISVTDEAGLLANLRAQIEKLNDYHFYDSEWERFCGEYLINAKEGILEKTRKIQIDRRHSFKLDNGLTKNIAIIDDKHIHNNSLQVLNQYEESGGTHQTRYDVTILVNGLPLVHVELKRRGVAIREAFNQIKRYQRDSFWAGSGLFEYVQIFVISNGTHTKYYSNTTRDGHTKGFGTGGRRKGKSSNSFEFTSFWADAQNKTIPDLVDFTKTFFAKHTLLNILARYCVFTSENMLLVMRPYQIVATERILSRIEISTNYRKIGTVEAGGYVWHTTGSGKTLTSFKTALLATQLSYIDKVLFVVDRKDLDYQTMKEYDRFQKDAANASTSTKQLEKNLSDPNAKIVITTIQKLDRFISRYKTHEIFGKHVVIIFDECHRSQFGGMHKTSEKERSTISEDKRTKSVGMHKKIKIAFKQYHIFGFTGTPIFAKNAGHGGDPDFRTTPQVFGCYLHGDTRNCPKGETHQTAIHTYTIVNAIHDKNVLPFRIDYLDTVRKKDGVKDVQVRAIDTESAMAAPGRIRENVTYVMDNFDIKTGRSDTYTHSRILNVAEIAKDKAQTLKARVKEQTGKVAVRGFNSILAVSNSFVIKGKRISPIELYYNEFQKQIAEKNSDLRIAAIFSYSANEEEADNNVPDEDFDNSKLDDSSRAFLERAMDDYNDMFGTSYETDSDSFQSYYKDISLRMKNREIDLLLVVNMFLTGFDATTLNTLWVDKNLKQHGLIQAFSRTNRILNSVKTFGNIVCFRNLKDATDAAIALFGDSEAGGIVLLKTYDEYYNGYEQDGKHKPGYVELVDRLTSTYPFGRDIVGEQAEKDFVRLFGAILKMKNILTAFDDFVGNEILSERNFQDYQSLYIDKYQEFSKKKDAEKENINDDIVFEIELIKQIEVNIDYILMLVVKYHESNCTDKSILEAIDKAVNSSIELRSKKELIEGFIARVNTSTQVDDDWQVFVQEQKEADLSELITDEKLKPEETRRFVDNAFRDGSLKTTGADVDRILPPVSRFGGGGRAEKKQGVIGKLLAFFEKYLGLV